MNIREIFEEYETNKVCVTDLGILYQGARVDYIILDPVINEVHIWGGDPDEDKFAEEFLPSNEERRFIYEQILDEM